MNTKLGLPLINDAGFRRLKDFVIQSTGLAYFSEKDDDLGKHISQRLAEVNVPDCSAYFNLLHDGQAGVVELDHLIERLTIGETFFFRHREMFDALRDTVLPDAIERNRPHRRLRIWSAGCSIGAEPYSIAILLKRELARLVDGWEITILGTDINREFLARAREGRYEQWAFRSVPDEIKQSCFSEDGNAWRIVPEFKQLVSFQYHNLVQHPFPSLVNNLFAFDVILCRNVVIYFSHDIIRKLLDHFHDTLVDDGWLLVGHAEPNIEFFRSFRTVNATGVVLYQKSEKASVPHTRLAPAPRTTDQRQSTDWTSWKPPGPITLPTGSALRPASQTNAEEFDQTRLPELAEVRSLADRGDLEAAADCCEQLVAIDSLNPVAHFYQAMILEQIGRHAEMEQSLKRALYLDRNYVLAHYYMGLTLQALNQSSRAARSFQNVLNLLAPMDHNQQIPDADELSVADLEQMTQMHLEALTRTTDCQFVQREIPM